MTGTPGVRRALFVAALALLLADCAKKDETLACPRGIVPADAAKVTRFRDGPGRDLTDVVNEGEIINILVQCKYNKQVVDMDLQIAVGGVRGPADRTRVAQFDYFVAIVDPQQNILVKEPFQVRFDFRDNRTQLSTREELTPRLPLSDTKTAPGYTIMVGFQLTPEELAWNRGQH